MEKVKLYEENNQTFLLPICEEVPIKSYLPLTIVSNIIVANSARLDWVYANFIQLFKLKVSNKIESFPFQST